MLQYSCLVIRHIREWLRETIWQTHHAYTMHILWPDLQICTSISALKPLFHGCEASPSVVEWLLSTGVQQG